MMGTVLGLGLNALLFPLSLVTPKKRGTVLLGAGLGKAFTGNPKYLFLHLHATAPRRVTWITKSSEVAARLAAAGLPVVSAHSLAGFWRILRSEYLVIESGTAAGIGGHDIAYERLFLGWFNVVQTWHGSPLKRICLDALRDRKRSSWLERLFYLLHRQELRGLRCIIALSDADARILGGAFDNERVQILGYPKNDPLVGDPGRWGLRPRWRRYDKVIVYAPTFRDHPRPRRPFSPRFIAALGAELARRNWCLLIKRHAFDRSLELPASSQNIFDVSAESEDIQELLVEADLLVTDYSSVFIDYLLRERPIIFYFYDLPEYLERSRQMYYDLPAELWPIAQEEQQLLELILTHAVWSETSGYRRRLGELRRRFHRHTDGNAAERLRILLDSGELLLDNS